MSNAVDTNTTNIVNLVVKKVPFTVQDGENTLKLAVIKPNAEQLNKGQQIYAKVWRESVENGLVVRAKLEKLLRSQGVWTDEDSKEEETLIATINDKTKELSKGGKKEDGKKVALEIAEARQKLRMLRATYNAMDANTAEAHADNAQFDYLASQCIVYEDTGTKYFDSYTTFLNKKDTIPAVIGATKLYVLLYNLDFADERNLPENKFLMKYGYMDQDFNEVAEKPVAVSGAEGENVVQAPVVESEPPLDLSFENYTD